MVAASVSMSASTSPSVLPLFSAGPPPPPPRSQTTQPGVSSPSLPSQLTVHAPNRVGALLDAHAQPITSVVGFVLDGSERWSSCAGEEVAATAGVEHTPRRSPSAQ